jgi:hypothetical protein
MMQPELMKKAKEEVDRVIIKPFLEKNPDFKGTNIMEKALNYENIWDL